MFTRTRGVWNQQGNKLVATDAIGGAGQGVSVSLSSDGNTAIVGGYGDNSFIGAAWVFTRTDGVWSQQGNKLVGAGAVGTAYQGISVSLSTAGNTAIVGGYGDNGFIGAAWVFTRTGGVWNQQRNKLVGTGAVGGAYQGRSVSLSSDGNTAIVGGWYDNNFAGATWVYTRGASSVRELGGDVPLQFGLEQNYPNPFNPSTTINYDIPSDGGVSLNVYNYLGQEVAILVDELQQAGRYQRRWDANGVVSGVYFYKITAGGYSRTQRMLLIK